MDRQTIVQSIVEAALRAAADPSVTTVLLSWDYYDPGSSVQPIMPILVVALTDDEELGIDFGLFRASCTVSIVADWANGVRDSFDRIRTSVRSVMHALPGLSAGGVTLDGVRELSCTEPEIVSPEGDVVLSQTLAFQIWFSAPVTQDAVLDPEPYLIDVKRDAVYLTRSASDPRRIERFRKGPPAVSDAAFGAWADRAGLDYAAPLPPLSTASSLNLHQPPADASASRQNETETP